MQRNSQASIPGESRGNFTRTAQITRAAQAGRGVSAGRGNTSAMATSGVPRPPMLGPQMMTQGPAAFGRVEHLNNGRKNGGDEEARTMTQGEKLARQAAMGEYYAGKDIVNLDDYFLGTLKQFENDSSVLNPMNISIVPDSSASTTTTATTSSTEELLQKLVKSAPTVSSTVDIAVPIGHSAIDDTRIFFDTLVLPQSYNGYPSGEIPIQFADLNGMSSPERVVKMTLSPFNFPHIYAESTTIFDTFYFRTVYMTVRFVPTTHLVQSKTPNDLFTYELTVQDIDSSAVFLVPFEPTFIMKQPVTSTGDLTVRFERRTQRGGMAACQIPPTRVRATYTANGAGPPAFTRFQLPVGMYIGVLAPAAVTYTVPIVFQVINPAAPTAMETDLITAQGAEFQTSNFTWNPITRISTFDIPYNCLVGGGDIFMFIPKNGVSFAVRFSCAQANRTNDLIPIHI